MQRIGLEGSHLAIVALEDAALGTTVTLLANVQSIDILADCHTLEGGNHHIICRLVSHLFGSFHIGILSSKRHPSIEVEALGIILAVRHTDDVRCIGLNLLYAGETFMTQTAQPEVKTAGVTAERSYRALILMGDGLHGKRQCQRLPAAADANLRLLSEITSVADLLSTERLRAVPVIVALSVLQHNLLRHTVHHDILHTLRCQSRLVDVHQQVRIANISILLCRDVCVACLDTGKGRTFAEYSLHVNHFFRIEVTYVKARQAGTAIEHRSHHRHVVGFESAHI